MTSDSLPILLSTLALGAAGVALAMISMEPPAPAGIDPAALEAIRAEQARLRNEVVRLRAEIPKPSMVAPDVTTETERQELPVRTAQLSRQVEALVARLTRLEQQARETGRDAPAPSWTGMRGPKGPQGPLTPAQRQQRITELKVKAMDPNQPEAARLAALGQLRFLGKGARSGAVAQAMIQLAQTSQDPKVRADVWRQMHRADDQQLIDPMIQALVHDTDRRTRAEAAESLGFFLDESRVKAALEQAKGNDPDEKVRAEAERSLAGRNR